MSRQKHETFGFSSESAQVIPNGIDINRFSPAPTSRDFIRASLGISKKAVVIGHVARFHPMKDHALFLHVTSELARKHERLHVVLVGTAVTPGNKALLQCVPDHLRSQFHFLGERHDIPELMNAFDIVCLSSAWGEAWPNVLGEAMSSAIPCLATDVGDSAQIVSDTGMIVPREDAEAMAKGLERLVLLPAEERQAMGAAARERITENFALETVVNQYAALYENLMINRA